VNVTVIADTSVVLRISNTVISSNSSIVARTSALMIIPDGFSQVTATDLNSSGINCIDISDLVFLSDSGTLSVEGGTYGAGIGLS
jgi:hypothetical protein